MKKLLIIIIFPLLALSCNSDYLDLAPNGAISEATFWKTENDADLALTGCYRGWDSWIRVLYFDAATDNGLEQYDYGVKQIGNGSVTPTTNIVAGWGGTSGVFAYDRIRKYNDFLGRIDNIEMDAAKKERYKAEVRFLRAFDYFKKISYFGDMPLVTEVLADPAEASLPRTPKSEIEKFILDELDDLIKGKALPVQNVIESGGHITLGAVYALKARLTLYMGDYETAQQAAAAVIAMPCFELYQGGYEKLFLPAAESENKEAILSIQYIADKYKHMASVTCMPNSKGGWAALQASWELVKAYESKDGTPFNEDEPFKNKDPRMKMTFFYPGAEFYGDYFDPFDGPDKHGNPINCPTRMPVHKYCEPTTGEWNQWGDFMVFRLAEMYLTFAECALHTGIEKDKALEYINFIRARKSVEMPAKNELTEQLVRNERRVELAFEGLRYFDIKRWDIGDDALGKTVYGTKQGAVNHENGEVTWFGNRIIAEERIYHPERNYLLPIPQYEMDLNPNMTQNPGYN